MTRIQVSVYTSDLSFIANVPRRRAPKFTDEQNTAQPGWFEMRLLDPLLTTKPNLLDRRNIVVFRIRGQVVFGWQIINLDPARATTDEEEWVRVSGPDVLNVLNAAKIGPEFPPLAANTRDLRWFDFASRDYDDSSWAAPVGVEQAASTSRAGYPLKWPALLKHSKWLWSSNPDASSAVGYNWFRGNFTLGADTDVKIYASSDNELDLRLNGVRIFTSKDAYQFRRTVGYPVRLAAGTNYLAASVHNAGGPAGLLLAVATVDSNGNPTSAVFQSLVGSMKVLAYTPRPGFTKAGVLQLLIEEGQDRGVHELLPVTFGFTPTADSASVAWTDVMARSEQVELTLVDEVAQKYAEGGLDMAMTPDFSNPTPALRFDLWNARGTDRSSTVRLLVGGHVEGSTPTLAAGRVRTVTSVRFDGGWVETSDAAASTLRREVGISAGELQHVSDAQNLATHYLAENAEEEVTIPIQHSSAHGKQPYVDFFLGDTISVLGPISGQTKARVMSITGEEIEGNRIAWTTICYPIT